MESLLLSSQSGAWVNGPVMAGLLGLFPHVVSFILTDGLVHMAAVSKEHESRSFRASRSQGLEVRGCHLCHKLLVRASHKVSSDSRQWGNSFHYLVLMGVAVKNLWPYLTYCRASYGEKAASRRESRQENVNCVAGILGS